jgi:hypothetical protein
MSGLPTRLSLTACPVVGSPAAPGLAPACFLSPGWLLSLLCLWRHVLSGLGWLLLASSLWSFSAFLLLFSFRYDFLLFFYYFLYAMIFFCLFFLRSSIFLSCDLLFSFLRSSVFLSCGFLFFFPAIFYLSFLRFSIFLSCDFLSFFPAVFYFSFLRFSIFLSCGFLFSFPAIFYFLSLFKFSVFSFRAGFPSLGTRKLGWTPEDLLLPALYPAGRLGSVLARATFAHRPSTR